MARPRAFDESAVISAAREKFWSCGYAATSVDDLSAATGLGKGSLYGAFGDKHGLYLKALDSYCIDMIAIFRTELTKPNSTPVDRLVHHIRSQARLFASDSLRKGCMMASAAAELAAVDAAVAEIVERSLTDWRNALVDCIRGAQRDGAIDPNLNAQALATTVLAFLRGLEALDKGGIKPAQIKASAEAFLRMISPPR
ncbi:MAG: TetR/AcrR family transcriptional regulator [Mycobacterium sp.]